MKRSEKVAISSAVLAVVAVAGFVAWTLISSQRKSAAMQAIRLPESVAIYRDLQKAPPDTDAPAQDVLSEPRKHMASFQAILEQFRTLSNTEEYRHISFDDSAAKRPDDFWDRAAPVLDSWSDYLDDVRRVAALGGPVQPLDFSRGYQMELPHLGPLRQLHRILNAHAELELRRGNVEGPLDDFIAAMKLGDAVVEEPTLISQLVRIAIYGGTWETMGRVLPSDLTHDQAERLSAHLAGASHREAFSDSYAGEVELNAVMAAEPERLVQQHENVLDYLFQNNTMFVLYNTPIGAPLLNADVATSIEIMSRMQDAAALPFYQAQPILHAIELEIDDLPSTRVLSRNFLPGLTRAIDAQARHDASLGLARLGIAIEQFHVDFGLYPAGLSDLAAAFPDGIPVDPCNGDAYHYEVLDSSYRLYSVGPDREDDQARFNFQDGDIVWRQSEHEGR